jgi:hypothetical protein
MMDATLDAIRAIIQEDVNNRGLRTDPHENLVTACPQDFAAACYSLASAEPAAVGVVTGFFIPHGQPPCGETDGPLGALFLARALVPLGVRVVLITDGFCVRALEAGLAAAGLRKSVAIVPLPAYAESCALSLTEYWTAFADRAGPLTHLISLERVGPSHTRDSLLAQPGATEAHLADYLQAAPPEHHDRCHTMRGRDITPQMSPAHRLFEVAARRQPTGTTIGIGDGGNEIGMGKLSWDLLRRNIPGGGLVACRVPCDHLIVCGVSNWGAYGLAAAVRLLRAAPPDAELFHVDRERELLRIMVERGPLVDGVSGEQDVSVDGLPFERYVEPLRQIGSLLSQVGGA